MNTPIMETEDEVNRLEIQLAVLKRLHEQQTQSLLAARIEAKLVADELRNLIGLAAPQTVIILTPIISRLRKIAEGK